MYVFPWNRRRLQSFTNLTTWINTFTYRAHRSSLCLDIRGKFTPPPFLKKNSFLCVYHYSEIISMYQNILNAIKLNHANAINDNNIFSSNTCYTNCIILTSTIWMYITCKNCQYWSYCINCHYYVTVTPLSMTPVVNYEESPKHKEKMLQNSKQKLNYNWRLTAFFFTRVYKVKNKSIHLPTTVFITCPYIAW